METCPGLLIRRMQATPSFGLVLADNNKYLTCLYD
jgi:hypothetical protein